MINGRLREGGGDPWVVHQNSHPFKEGPRSAQNEKKFGKKKKWRVGGSGEERNALKKSLPGMVLEVGKLGRMKRRNGKDFKTGDAKITVTKKAASYELKRGKGVLSPREIDLGWGKDLRERGFWESVKTPRRGFSGLNGNSRPRED